MKNADTQEVLSDFLLSLKLANRSKYTINEYRRFLEHFFKDKEKLYLSLTSDEIHEWLITHFGHRKESTFKTRLSILSSFYTFCVQEEHMEQSPIKKRWFPRLPKPIPRYLEKGDVAKARQVSEMTSIRNQVMVELMLSTGCRVGEVHRLNRDDIDLVNRTARVIGKGNKIRQVHFTDKCAVLLEKHMDQSKNKSSALFLSIKRGKRLTIRGMQHIITKLGKEAGLTTNLHPHRFRHTFATELLSKGADMSFISEELGHSDLSTTQIYARLPKREIVAQYRKFMG